jgi:hypothetical protein
VAFGGLGAAAYTAAARADQIGRSPAAALAVAVAGLVVLGALARRIVPRRGGGAPPKGNGRVDG